MLVFATILALAQPAAAPHPHEHVDQDRLMADLEALPRRRAARANTQSVQGLADTEDRIVVRLKELGYEPTLEPLRWTIAGERAARETSGMRPGPEVEEPLASRTWHNVIVELPGKGPPDLAREFLLIGAHFDAAPGASGADDNGTGTVALLELARVLRDAPMDRTVRLVFFNLEEAGLLGSIAHASLLKPALDDGSRKLIGMVSLEMLGYFTDEPGSQRSPIPRIEGVFDPPTVGDFIALATTKSYSAFAKRLDEEMRRAAPGLKTVTPDFLPDLPLCPPDILRSDHAPFLAMGQPAVMLTDTSNFRNPHYHRDSDTPDTIDPVRFAQVVRALAGAVHAIAGPQTTTPGR